MKPVLRALAATAAAAVLAAAGCAVWLGRTLPDTYYVVQGETFSLNWIRGVGVRGVTDAVPAALLSRAGNSYRAQLTLAGGIPIKEVSVRVVEPDTVIPGGTPFGIKMFTDGVMIVGMSDLEIGGVAVNPAKACGLRTGDVILSLDGRSVTGNEDVGALIAKSGGRSLSVRYAREGVVGTATLTPVLSPSDGVYRAGMWVRDSTAGIGTLTYYDPAAHRFAGLGHAVCDADTSARMPLGAGEAVGITITGVTKSVAGLPGELHGVFAGGSTFGVLTANTDAGLYGTAFASPVEAEPVRMATAGEVHAGKATMLTTIRGTTPQAYEVEIEKIFLGGANTTRNLVVRVTDAALLAETGGILQGMSGSPLLQDGKLIGAVTHVFVNDPTRGYGIFAETMRQTAEEAA